MPDAAAGRFHKKKMIRPENVARCSFDGTSTKDYPRADDASAERTQSIKHQRQRTTSQKKKRGQKSDEKGDLLMMKKLQLAGALKRGSAGFASMKEAFFFSEGRERKDKHSKGIGGLKTIKRRKGS